MCKFDLAQSNKCSEKGERNSAVFDEISDMKGAYLSAIKLLEAVIVYALNHSEAEGSHNPESQKDVSEYISEKHEQDYEQDQRNKEGEADKDQNLGLPASLVPTLSMRKATTGRPDQGVQIQMSVQGLEEE